MIYRIHYTLMLALFAQLTFAQTQVIKTIHFSFDQHTLNQEEKSVLDSVAMMANSSAGYTIILHGHTDGIGTDQYNESLAQARCEAVKSYLISKKLNLDQIQIQGFGERKPLLTNNNRSNRAQNRRVELTLYVQSPQTTATTVDPERVIQKPKVTRTVTNEGVIIEHKGEESPIDISLVSNVSQMETRNFTTETTNGEALRSNVMFCVKRTNPNGPCELEEPVVVLIPVNNKTALCRALATNFYEAQKDSVTGAVKWKQVPKTYEVITQDGKEYFRLEIKNACAPCKNFDCPAGTSNYYVKINSQRYVITKVTTVYQTENTLLSGSPYRNKDNTWKAMRLTQGNTRDELIKVELSDQKGQKHTVALKLEDLHRRRHFKYVMKKKELLLALER